MKKNAEYVGVNDEYIPKNEKYVDESTFNKEQKDKFVNNLKKGGKIALGVYVGYIIIVALLAVLIIGMTIIGFIRFNKVEEKIIDNSSDIIKSIVTMENDINEDSQNNEDKIDKDIEKMNKQYEDGEEKVQKMINQIENQINNN